MTDAKDRRIAELEQELRMARAERNAEHDRLRWVSWEAETLRGVIRSIATHVGVPTDQDDCGRIGREVLDRLRGDAAEGPIADPPV